MLKDTTMGFRRSITDRCLYFHDIYQVILLIYVDDLVWIGLRASIDTLKAKLSAIFPTKGLGPLTEFLGIDIVRDRKKRTLQLSQAKYAEQRLRMIYYFCCCSDCSCSYFEKDGYYRAP